MTSRIIGITGGIAMGKTTVSNRLETYYGLTVLDADSYARDAVAIGTPILNAITLRYGPEILLPDQSLYRAKLGQIIFSQPDDRTWLNAQIHPEVRVRMQQDSDRFRQIRPFFEIHEQMRHQYSNPPITSLNPTVYAVPKNNPPRCPRISGKLRGN